MKRFSFIFLFLVCVLLLKAQNSYLTLEMRDGSKLSIPVSMQKLVFSGDTLNIDNKSLPLSSICKICFSNIDESSDIESIYKDDINNIIDYYDLQGHRLTKEWLKKGIYIVRTKRSSNKMVILK